MPMPLSLETMNPMEPMLHGKRDCADAIKIINIKREIILNYLGVKNHVKVVVTQLCLTLYDPIDCSPPRILCPWNSLGKNTGVGSCSLLPRIFLTQGSNLGLPHCRQILYCLSHYIWTCKSRDFLQLETEEMRLKGKSERFEV